MPVITGTTKAQTLFLRSFRNSPTGPSPQDWPSPAVLRRWLRSQSFVAALNSIRDTLRFQVDFQLASAAAQAARLLSAPNPEISRNELKRLSDLLRLAHLRQRFPFEPNLTSPATFRIGQEIPGY